MVYPLAEGNKTNLSPKRVPVKHKVNYEGAYSLIITADVTRNPLMYDYESGDVGRQYPRLEFFDLNNFYYPTGAIQLYSINDNKYNTWLDMYSWPSNGVVIETPPVKENYVDIPGGNGSLDFTDRLTGYPLYENRIGSIPFEVDPFRDSQTIESILKQINARLHGQKVYALIADGIKYVDYDGDGNIRPYINYQPWYYEGRLSVSGLSLNEMSPSWSLDYNFKPYKKLLWTTAPSLDGGDVEWDPFDFDDGIFYADLFQDVDMETFGDKSVGSWIGSMPTVPTIYVNATEIYPGDQSVPPATELGAYIRVHSEDTIRPHDSKWIFLPNGEHKDPRLTLKGDGISILYDGFGDPVSTDTERIAVKGIGTINIDFEIGVI